MTDRSPSSSRKRPIRVSGMLAQSASYMIPDQIRKKFAADGGWASHIPLTFLTDKFCAQKSGTSTETLNESLSIDTSTGKIVTASRTLSITGEMDLTFDEWYQAWRRLLDLVQQYLSDEYECWNHHFCRIRDAESRSEHWPLWIAYDTEVRRRAVYTNIDPKEYHIGLWNELEVRYNQSRVKEAMNLDLRRHVITHIITTTPRAALKTALFEHLNPKDVYSVVAPTTPLDNATLQNLSTEIHATFRKENHLVIRRGATNTENFTVGHGTETAAVQTKIRTTVDLDNISARFADRPRTTLNHANSEFLLIVTPFVANAWEEALHHTNLFYKFSDVPFGICNGFDMGIKTTPSSTYTPPNHTSALKQPQAVLSHIQKELSLSRYTGPFSRSKLESLIGSFRTSPLGVVPKAGTSDEFRLVQDFSFPRNNPDQRSVNSEIDMDEFRCDWGTFDEIVSIVRNAPPLSEAATLDVDSAFRRIPIHPSQQSSFVIGWQNLYYIDHAAPFGAASSGGVFGRTADALMAIFHSKEIIARNWVDDFVFFRCPTNKKPSIPLPKSFFLYYTLDTIYAITTPLGWPWKHSKTRPFSEIFKYLGFLWNLKHKTVQIPDDKKTQYLVKLTPWVEGQKFTLRETESIFGTLVHCSLAVPEGCSRLPALSRFVSSFLRSESPFSRRTPNKSVLTDITWWRKCLEQKFCGSSLAAPPIQSPLEFWVDASTDWGIGVVFDGEWNSWKLKKNWKSNGRNIGWAEFVAIEIGLLHAIHLGHSNTHFLIRSDNQGVIQAIKGGKSRSPEQNNVLQRITSLLATHSLWISSLYVPSADNISDGPSRGIPLDNLPRSNLVFTLPPTLETFIESSSFIQ
ncbi:hypothetical protein CVT25_004971 [Psilocybe cyanescens]|uniref:Reverse transcriptase domain-containing protein n=1 Tax=Psilocybe cyanescens TaxID=93625 RepID=A0A409XU81_PSICY|nr:hypothetical protein CVT25_004971 [Psilocybe cyanescens]